MASKYIVQYAKENRLDRDTVIASIDEFDVEGCFWRVDFTGMADPEGQVQMREQTSKPK